MGLIAAIRLIWVDRLVRFLLDFTVTFCRIQGHKPKYWFSRAYRNLTKLPRRDQLTRRGLLLRCCKLPMSLSPATVRASCKLQVYVGCGPHFPGSQGPRRAGFEYEAVCTSCGQKLCLLHALGPRPSKSRLFFCPSTKLASSRSPKRVFLRFSICVTLKFTPCRVCPISLQSGIALL